jgi:hypothetical protein
MQRVPCSSTLQGSWRLHRVGSILKLRQDIRHCVEVEAHVRVIVVMCCTNGARPGNIARPNTIARSDTKVMACWRCAVQVLRNTLPASTVGRDLTESTLSFLKVEHKYVIKWSFSFFWWPLYYIPLKRCTECCFLQDPQLARPTHSRSHSQIVSIEHPATVNISIERNIVTQAGKSRQTTYHYNLVTTYLIGNYHSTVINHNKSGHLQSRNLKIPSMPRTILTILNILPNSIQN